jgi:hypothetical protein
MQAGKSEQGRQAGRKAVHSRQTSRAGKASSAEQAKQACHSRQEIMQGRAVRQAGMLACRTVNAGRQESRAEQE